MPDFIWRAADASGQIQEGRLSAAHLAQAQKQLRERKLTPLSLRLANGQDAIGSNADVSHAASKNPAKSTFGKASSGDAALKNEANSSHLNLGRKKVRQGRGPVNQADVLLLTSELSIMLRAGLALDNALRVLIGMSHKPSVSVLTNQILEDVKSGTSFSKALSKNQALFGDFYINMIRSGEVSGQMSAVLERLVEHMERLRVLRSNVISSLMYPFILLIVAALSVVGMLGFVVPQFEKLFISMGDALPWMTQIVMAAGQGFKKNGLYILIASVVVIWLLWLGLRSESGKRWWQSWILRVPLLGSLVHKYEMTLFARSMGTLLGNGVPMMTALHIATDSVGNAVLHRALSTIAPKVKEGKKVVEASEASGVFEPLAINLIKVGEETGRIGPMMLELAKILNTDVENYIKRALTLLEPLLIMILGSIIAVIIISILLGILSVNELVA